jgi:hypothetical protein
MIYWKPFWGAGMSKIATKFIGVAQIISAIASACFFATPAYAETRVALVIGNANYAHNIRLANPEHDADSVTAALRKVGFTVDEEKNLTEDAMKIAILSFSEKARDSDVAVVYYAGHGIQRDGINYLVPVDAELKTPASLRVETIQADVVLDIVAQARRLRLLILDACRNDPWIAQLEAMGTRGISRGLAPMAGGNDTITAYSAKDNTEALDGSGANSPYAAALAKRIVEPNTELDKMFREVRDDVMAETGDQQEPFVYGSRGGGDFFFNPVAGPGRQTPNIPGTPLPAQVAGWWKASGGRGQADFGGAPYANYRTTLSSVGLTLQFDSDGRVVSANASALATEEAIDHNSGTLPPNTHNFSLSGSDASVEKISLIFNGVSTNQPPSKAHFEGRLQPDGRHIIGTLTVSRNDESTVSPQVLWSISVPLVLVKQ